MLHALKTGWLVIVLCGGAGLALLALLAHDPGGAAVMAGIALLLALVPFLLPEGNSAPRRKSRGFEPHRRR